MNSVKAWVKPGVCAGRAGQRPGRRLERRQSAAGAVLHVALEAAAGADAGHRGRLEHEHEGLAQLAHLLAQVGQDAVLRQPGFDALLERLQRARRSRRCWARW